MDSVRCHEVEVGGPARAGLCGVHISATVCVRSRARSTRSARRSSRVRACDAWVRVSTHDGRSVGNFSRWYMPYPNKQYAFYDLSDWGFDFRHVGNGRTRPRAAARAGRTVAFLPPYGMRRGPRGVPAFGSGVLAVARAARRAAARAGPFESRFIY